ncbi:uncharacterized protein J3R85_012810 [Psidium guajava]|nr:uncharacterized protein J3R85_012810 [Psidium guajava]
MANGAKSKGLRTPSEVVGLKSRIGWILTSVRRFAVDSAIIESLGGINGSSSRPSPVHD